LKRLAQELPKKNTESETRVARPYEGMRGKQINPIVRKDSKSEIVSSITKPAIGKLPKNHVRKRSEITSRISLESRTGG